MNRKAPSLRLTASERQQAKQLADDNGRSTANFARQMYLRGLTLYLAEQRQAA